MLQLLLLHAVVARDKSGRAVGFFSIGMHPQQQHQSAAHQQLASGLILGLLPALEGTQPVCELLRVADGG